MKNKQKQPASNFWFGFSFGILATAGAAYLLGTKKGREDLKKVMEYAEQYGDREGNIFDLVHELAENKVPDTKEVKSNLESVIDKVKSMTSGK